MSEILSFEDEAQAYAEIEAMGYHAMAFDFPAEENDLHWHEFDSVLYVSATFLPMGPRLTSLSSNGSSSNGAGTRPGVGRNPTML